MPSGPRFDASGTLHHVMVRGIERTAIFRDDTDRTDFLAPLARVGARGALTTYAWALLPNHAHLLLRSGTQPLAPSMRSLLTGYAFSRRHRRAGHLFQIGDAPCAAHGSQRRRLLRHVRQPCLRLTPRNPFATLAPPILPPSLPLLLWFSGVSCGIHTTSRRSRPVSFAP